MFDALAGRSTNDQGGGDGATAAIPGAASIDLTNRNAGDGGAALATPLAAALVAAVWAALLLLLARRAKRAAIEHVT
jgi:uncharacterized membrane-anchored protein